MNKETFIQNLQASPVSDEHKQAILALIESKGWNVDTIEAIKDIIQTDIESDLDELTDEDKVHMQVAENELISGLDAVEATLAEDLAFVEAEMNDLEKMTKELDKTVDEAEIDTLKKDITNL